MLSEIVPFEKHTQGGEMRSEPHEKNAEKCGKMWKNVGKNAEKAEKMQKKMWENADHNSPLTNPLGISLTLGN